VGVEFIRASNNSIMRVLTASGTRWVTMTNGLFLGNSKAPRNGYGRGRHSP
jgi:hypothetical protein